MSKSLIVGYFGGQNGTMNKSWFLSLTQCGLDAESATLVTMDCNSSYAEAMSKDTSLKGEIAKANKDGQSAFKISGKTAAIATSPAMSLVRLCQQLEKLEKEGLCNREGMVKLLSKRLSDYLESVQERSAEIEWKQNDLKNSSKEKKASTLTDLGVNASPEVASAE